MKLQIDHIMTFYKVVQHASFSAAAEAMHVSKSVVSKHVTSLEEALSVKLLHRSTRQLMLTEEGRTFYQAIKSIPDQIDNAEVMMQAHLAEPHGLLKVIAPLNFSVSLKKQVIPEYLRDFQKVTLHIEFVDNTSHHVNDDFDIIVLWKLAHQQFPNYHLVCKPLIQLPLQLYATPTYLKQHGTPVVPNDLLKHACYASSDLPWPFIDKQGHDMLMNVSSNLKTSHEDIIRSVVSHHLGIAYSYPFMFMDELNAGTVVPIMQAYTNVSADVAAFYHPNEYLPIKIKLFIERLQAYFNEFLKGVNV